MRSILFAMMSVLLALMVMGRGMVGGTPENRNSELARAGNGFVIAFSGQTATVDDDGFALIGSHGAGRDFRVRTAKIDDMTIARAPFTEQGDRALERQMGWVRERFDARADGVEQSWSFANRPSGQRDLVVQVAVTGSEFVETRGTSAHFRVGRDGVRYGDAAWIDAIGVRTPVTPTWEHGRLTLRVPAETIARSAFPAVLDPTISTEILVDQGVPIPATRSVVPRVAASQSGSLVVWQGIAGDRAAILATRLDTSGKPIAATAAALYIYDYTIFTTAAVASDGTDYFVVWTTGTSNIDGIRGVRVRASDGAVIDTAPGGVELANSVPNFFVSAPDVTYSNGMYVVAFAYQQTQPDGSSTTGIRTQRFKDGVALDSLSGVSVGTGATLQAGEVSQLAPTLAAGSDQVFVVWSGCYGARETVSTGAVLDSTPVRFANLAASTVAHAAFDGTNYYMAWNQYNTIWGARVRASDGAALDPDDTFNSLPGSKNLGSPDRMGDDFVRVAAVDGMIAVVYQGNGQGEAIHAFVVDPSTGLRAVDAGADVLLANPAGTLESSGTTEYGDFEVAVGPAGNAEVVFQDPGVSTGAVGGVAGRALGHSNGQLSPIDLAAHLSYITGNASAPSVVSSGSDFFLAWNDSTTMRAYGARVSSSSLAALDLQGIDLGASEASAQSLASNGTEYLYVWAVTSGVYARPIALDGALGAQFTVRAGDGLSPPGSQDAAVAYDGTNYFVAWWEQDKILGARVDATTHAVLDANPIVVTTSLSTSPTNLSIAVDSPTDPTRKTFLIAWNELDSHSVQIARVRAALGAPIDPLARTIRARSVARGNPLVASDGTNVLVAWDEQRDGFKTTGVFGTRVVPLDATILDTTSLADGGIENGVLLLESPIGYGFGRAHLGWARLRFCVVVPDGDRHAQ